MMITNYDKLRIIDNCLLYLNNKKDKVDLMIEKNTINGIISSEATQFFNKEKSELMLQIEALLSLKASLN